MLRQREDGSWQTLPLIYKRMRAELGGGEDGMG